MEPTTRPLPEPDLEALFAVLVTVHAALLSDDLPDDLADRLARRLTTRGRLRPGASRGELNALLADLAERLHWAMDAGSAAPCPAPADRGGTFEFRFEPGADAAAFRAEVAALGGRPVAGDTTRVEVRFGELPPDPDFRARQEQLIELVARHGGEYQGWHT